MDHGTILRSRGMLAGDERRRRRHVFLACLIFSTSVTFLDLGFVALGRTVPHLCCVLPLVGPILATSLLLGTRRSLLHGLVAGAILLLHTYLIPSNIAEFLCVTPPVALGLELAAVVSSWLFALVLRGKPEGARRMVLLALVCIVGSAIVTVSFVCGLSLMPYRLGPLEDLTLIRSLAGSPAIQLVCDAAMATAVILPVDAFGRVRERPTDTLGVRLIFRLRLLSRVSLILVAVASLAFVLLTQYCWVRTDLDMSNEASYLMECITSELDEHGDMQGALPSLETMTSMYDLGTDGSIAICDKTTILATNNSAFSDTLADALQSFDDTDYMRMTLYEHGSSNAIQLGFIHSAREGDLRVVLIRPAESVFRDRLFAMASIAASTAALLVLVYIYAARLLRQLLIDPIDRTNRSLEKITSGDLDEVVDSRDSLEFASLSDGINTTVSALKDYAEESARQIARDLATARRIQQSALPRPLTSLPEGADFDIYASMVPAKDVAGDFYDFFPLDDHRLAFLIADVSGKGIPAALFMMEAKNEIRRSIYSFDDLATAMDRANTALCADNDEAMFVTAWAATLDWQTGELVFVNAGHNAPLLCHNGVWSWLHEKSGPLMGMADVFSYQSHTLKLSAGDKMLLYTDGVTEAMDSASDLYGEARLEAFLQAHPSLGPRELDAAVRDDIAGWAAGADQSDDITMLVLQLNSLLAQDR